LGKNDRESFSSSLLYLQEGDYFSEDEVAAFDGAFKGDGHLRCSCKNPGNEKVKKLFNLAFHEVRTGIENSYQVLGFFFWRITSASFHILKQFYFWPFMPL
jgi:hypothetical protein